MSEVYANILQALTVDLYNDIRYAVREYLQNAYDAIKQAKVEKIPQDDEYCVKIEIPKDNSFITIADNGIGMGRDLLLDYTSIGGGTKNSPEYAGHKGIGKLSGLRFFNEFRIITKTYGSTVGHELHWKCGEMMQAIFDNKELMKKTPYRDFISKYYSIKDIENLDKEKHYTQIQLIDIRDEFKPQLSERLVGGFIKQNCPVPFNQNHFNHSVHIEDWLGMDQSPISTYINEQVIYRYYNDGHLLVVPQLFEIKYNDQVHAKAWLSWIRDTAETIDDDMIRGIRFRCKGLCVGNDNLFTNNCLPTGSEFVAGWFTGEVIILDDSIIPSAARDRFIEGGNVNKFYSELRNKVGKELRLIANIRSEINGGGKAYNQIKANDSKGKVTLLSDLKNVSKRIKELEKYRAKDKYDFDFGIVEKLQNLLSEQEDHENDSDVKNAPQISNTIDKSPEEIIDKILELKEQQLNAFTPKSKSTKGEQIEQLKERVVSLSSGISIAPSVDAVEKILRIITKYLRKKEHSYSEDELREFIKNALH
jgi:hypothetical protein